MNLILNYKVNISIYNFLHIEKDIAIIQKDEE